MSGVGRRAVVAAAPALALGSAARAALRDPASVRGRTTYSESAMVMSVSADGRSALTLRVCRFPDADLTWLWCHIVRDGEIYAFARHDLPCTADRLADRPDADYGAAWMVARLARSGKGASLKRVRTEALLPFHTNPKAPLGAGPTKGLFVGEFTPTHVLASQVLKDRDEVYGVFKAVVEAGGEQWTHAGPAKFHEQRQTAPRFQAPFCYSWLGGDRLGGDRLGGDRLGGDGLAATTLLFARGASGGWLFGQTEDGLADMTVERPGASRAVRYRLKSGRDVRGELSAIVRYEIPIWDRRWQGSFVRGQVDGKPVVGVMNDWTAGPDIYAAAQARLG